jgi:hypothetical protein
LPGVKVTITNTDSGNSVATQTDASGTYLRPFLFPGSYRVTAFKDGFTEESVDARVPLNSTTEIKPPRITIRLATISTTTTPQPPTTQPPATQPPATQTTPTPVKERESSILVNKSDPTRGGNFDKTQLLSLPLPGIRTFDSLAFLVPGVAEPPESIGRAVGPGIGAGVGTLGQFSVNGNRSRANNFTIDGSDNNDQDIGVRRQGFVALIPQSMETLQEFRISTLLWDAELGRNPGSQVNAVSRGGSNDFHGQLYTFVTDSSLNARNAFDFEGGPSRGKDSYTRSQTGIVVGGPIVRNRTQFFASVEYLHIGATSEQHFATPTAAERRFGGLPKFEVVTPISLSQTDFLAYTTKAGATPAGLNVLQFYPLPNNPGGPYGANTFTEVLPANGRGLIGSFKLTQRVTPRNQLNGRYNATDDDRDLPSIKRAISSQVLVHTRTQDLSLILDSSISQSLVNQGRFSFGRTRLNFFGDSATSNGTLPVNVSAFAVPSGVPVDLSSVTSQTGPIGELLIQPFSPVGVDTSLFPQGRVNNTFQYADTLSKTRGNHSFKVGADIRRIQLNSRQDRNFRSSIQFDNGALFDFTGVVAGTKQQPDFLGLLPAIQFADVGIASSAIQTLTPGTPDSTIGLRYTEYNFFFNDTWRIRQNFSLDYGLRYEYNTVPHEVNNRIESALKLENLPPTGTPTIDLLKAPSCGSFDGGPPFNQQLSCTQVFENAVAAYRSILDGRTSIYDADRNNFAPHVGFAWNPRSDGKTSIRGGYGIYYDATLGAVVSQSRNVFPNEIPFNLDNFAFFPDGIFLNNPASLGFFNQTTFSFTPIVSPNSNQIALGPENLRALIGFLFAQGLKGGLAFTLPEKHLRTPYVQQWHITLEREIFRDFLVAASYVGTKGTKLTRLTTPNGGPSVTPGFPILNPNSALPIAALFIVDELAIPRPNKALGAYQVFENSANSNYHALQLEARKRYSNGLTFTAAYTWSHAIDEVSDIVDTAGASALPQNSFDLRAERGNASFDVRHRFSASVIWDLPFYRNSSDSAARWLGGWQLASIFQARSGQPYTLILPFDDNSDGNLTDRPAGTKGLTFLDGHGSQRVVLAPGKTLTDIITDLSPDFNGLARAGRNTFRGDRFINLDVALSKSIRFYENQNLEFRSEFFNALNRANFGLPIRVIGAPGFGSSVDTVNPARTIQFALKYSF